MSYCSRPRANGPQLTAHSSQPTAHSSQPTAHSPQPHSREEPPRRRYLPPMLRFTTAGESHGPALVSVLEGVPAGLPLLAADVNVELRRRQQGYGRGRRMQIEIDTIELLSGVRAGETLGSPIAMEIHNRE